MDIYRYFETGAETHSSTNAYLLALISKYIYPTELPPGSGSFDSRFHTHFRGLSDTDPLLCNAVINNGVEAEVMSNSRVIIVAFRGTEISADFEWIGGVGNLGYGFYEAPRSWSQVKIHAGFYHGLQEVSANLINTVQTLKGQQDRPVFLSGHSRGGAFALILAYQLQSVENINVAGVYVYGCPRVGDAKFKERYQANGLWDITFRWANYKDPATQLPVYSKSIFSDDNDKYWHVGQLNYIRSQGSIVFNHSNPEFEPGFKLLSPYSTIKFHEINRYCTRMFAQLSTEQRASVTQPAYLTKDDPVGEFPESKFDPASSIVLPLPYGVYTIQQKSNSRFVDAHENARRDFSLVTRTAQNNDSQKWILSPLGNDTYTIQHRVNNRFVDAHESSQFDFSLVTRMAQNNDSQKWKLSPLGDDVYTIQHGINSRFVDAHGNQQNDFSLVTRTAQNDDTQRWIIKPL